MVDFQGISTLYLPGDSAEKRKSDPGTGLRMPTLLQQSNAQPPGRDYAVVSSATEHTQPQPGSASAPHTAESIKTLNIPATNALPQTLPGTMERVVALVGSFFFGRRKNVTDEEELEKRQLNDFFSLDFLGERKVEAAHHSTTGDEPD